MVWLGLEVVLSVLRLSIWAINPITDDPPPPIVISAGDHGTDVVTYDIGWKLEDVTVKDMHAVVIDIPNQDLEIHENELNTTPSTLLSNQRRPMFEYLTKHLAVPDEQVKHVYGCDPKAIEDALQSLAKDTTIRRGSPIIIYISHHTDNTTDSKWIGNKGQGLSYSTFFEFVRRISETKGENVVSRNPPNAPSFHSSDFV